jgi:cytochrome oxidase Cu insertion factor (SCO1/SenC/PrrC family)
VRRVLTRLALALVVLATAGCAAAAPAGPAVGAPAGAPAGPAAVGPVTAPTVDGGSFDMATLAGKPAVLWFWAPF